MSSDTLSPFIVLRRYALALPARWLCPNALGAARASLFSKMHRCHHPLCCLFVGLAQIVWVVPVHHFFQKCIGATTPWVACLLVLHCPCITFFKNALVLPPLVLLVRGACPNALGAAPASLFSKMHWCYHSLCCLFVGLAQMLWVLPLHDFFQKCTGATSSLHRYLFTTLPRYLVIYICFERYESE